MTERGYAAPRTVEEAIGLLKSANGSARVLAGGTDLLVQLRTGMTQAGLIVDVKRIPELVTLTLNGSGLRIGAATPAAEITENQAVASAYPGLVEAVDLIGSSQIQGRASVGGNLCNGSPAADTVPALIALAAEAVIAGPNGERRVAVESFVEGPGKTVLQPGELLVELVISPRPARSADAYLRFIPRTEMDIAVVGAGVDLTLEADGRCSAARVALGAVAPTPIRVPEAEAALIGSSLDDAALTRAAEAASAACNPIDDKRGTVTYRRRVAGVLLQRATRIAAERAAGRNA